jgi:hypothetical protein
MTCFARFDSELISTQSLTICAGVIHAGAKDDTDDRHPRAAR